jgi:PAS domain S-box-containing protein
MHNHEKSREELLSELNTLREQCDAMKALHENYVFEHNLIKEKLIRFQILNKAIVNSTIDFIWSVDSKNFGITSFNKSFYDYFYKVRGKELKIGDRAEDLFISVELVEKWYDIFNKVLLGSIIQEYVVSVGTLILELNLYPLKHDNVVFGISIFGKDITERKKTEQLLIKSESSFRDVLENSLDASYKRNLETNTYEYLSPVFVEISGYESDVIMSLPLDFLFSFIHPDDLVRINYMMFELYTNTLIDKHEISYRFKPESSSEYKWIYDKFTVIRDEQYKPVALIGCLSDITERKLAEDELKIREADYRSIYDNAIEGMFSATLFGKKLKVNNAFAKLLGYNSVNEAIHSLENVLHQVWVSPNDQKTLIKLLRKSDTIQGYECQFRKLNGDVIWVSLNARLVRNENEEPLYFEGFIEDITNRKKNEQEIQNKMENLQWYYDIAISRELKMAELKKEINSLLIEAGYEKKYL